MLVVAAYIFQYGMFVLAALMCAWAGASIGKHPFTKRLSFRLFPLLLSAIMLARLSYSPIVITSPPNRTVIHPGEKITLTIELRPSFLSNLFPSVMLDLPTCWTCTHSPPGITVQGVLTGSPYRFTIDFPQDQRAGVLVTSATMSIKGEAHPAARSSFIELVVE